MPMYPLTLGRMGATNYRAREVWAPLFDKHGVKLAFEHHDHRYKRTWPIRGGKVVEDGGSGTIFLGDGNIGTVVSAGDKNHEVPPKSQWQPYIKNAGAQHHFFMVDLDGNGGANVQSIDHRGDVFDKVDVKSNIVTL